jgi:Raf kinase inhibitor-like YbhB/YbcL family protein
MRRLVRALSAIAALLVALALGACATAPSPESPASSAPSVPSPSSGGGRVLYVRSSAFSDRGRIPDPFVGVRSGGSNRSFPLEWSGAPTGTASFALAVVDHAPVARMFVHWLVVDIPPQTSSTPEGASMTPAMPAGARELRTTYGTPGYGGPNPPAGTGDHPYVVTLYALSVPKLEIGDDVTLQQFESTLEGKVLASATVTGMFSR